jgi:cytochrome c5
MGKDLSGGLRRWLTRLSFSLTLVASAVANGATANSMTERQAKLLTNNCVQCHARPNIGVPMTGNPVDWAARNKQGEDKLLTNTVHGLRGMPPLGYCSACSETDLRVLIRAMSGVDKVKL